MLPAKAPVTPRDLAWTSQRFSWGSSRSRHTLGRAAHHSVSPSGRMDDEEKRIQEAMKRGVPTTIDGYIKSGRSRAGSEATEAQAGGFVQNLTINSPRELNPSETARLNRKATQQMILKMKPA